MVFYPPKAKVGSALWFSVALLIATALLVVGLSLYILWGAANLSYQVTSDEVVITFGWKETSIDRSAITGVTIIEQPSRGRRHAGTHFPGTLYEGRWSFAETGRLTMFATSIQPLTVIETVHGNWGISPLDPYGFHQTVMSGSVGVFPPRPSDNTAGVNLLMTVVLLLTVPFPIIFTVYIVRITRHLRYELADQGLVVYGAWRSVFIPYDKIDSVRVESPEDRPWKMFGMGAPGLYWGNFSWKSVAPNLTLYATRLRPLVLLSVGQRTYGITPEDPDLFVTRLNERLEQSG